MGRRRRPLTMITLALAVALTACAPAMAADTYEPDNSPGQARKITTDGVAQTHEIQPASDVDYVRFSVVAGTQCSIETSATASAAVNDTVITLFGTDGLSVLGEDDDSGDGLYSLLTHTFAASGTYYVRVRSYGAQHTGGYRLSVRAAISTGLQGTVTRDGQPASGVVIWVRPAGSGFDRPTHITTTEAGGSYALSVAPGAYAVSAHLAGTVASPAEQQIAVPGGGAADFTLTSAAPTPGDGVQTCRAVLVGIADYAGSGMDLTYCDDDALEFGAALSGAGNWRQENITIIVDRQANRAAIWGALQRMATLSDADDLCLFFFSGHGARGPDVAPFDEGGGQDEFLVESDDEQNIRDDELGQWIADLPTTKFVGIIAACYSGGMIKAASAGTHASMTAKGLGTPEPAAIADGFADDLRRAIERKRQMTPLDLDDNGFGVVITAADDDETCQESEQLEHDVFVYYVLEGMGGPADANSDGWFSAEEIYAYGNPRATAFNSGQHAQLYDALPGVPLNFFDRNPAPQRTVTITGGPSGTPAVVQPGGEAACTVTAVDSYGGGLGYAWTATAGSFDDDASPTPTWTAPANTTGADLAVTIAVTARSLAEPAVTDDGSFAVTVLPGQQGDVRITDGPSADPAPVAPGEAVQCSVEATDGAGGALDYAWQARDPSGDPIGGFDDASAREPAWTPPAGANGTYTLSVTVSSQAAPEQTDAGVVEVRVATRLAHSFPAGVRMVALPGTAASMTLGQALGASAVASWDAATQAYSDADPTADAGAGCWARFDAATNAAVLCEAWPQDAFTWELATGWNMIALPWNARVSLSGLTTAPSGAVPQLAWTCTGGGYDLVSGLGIPIGAEDELGPWQSYWLYASEACTATLSRTVASAAAVDAATRADGWAVRLEARTASGSDSAALCGMSERGLRVPDLPPIAGAPELALEAASGELLAVDLRSDTGAAQQWPLRVSAAAGEEVTVLCPDLSAVPNGMRVVLEDRDAGRAVSLRTSAGYQFTAAEGPRRLVLRIEPGGSMLALSGVSAQQAPGGASICFTLSAPAQVSAEVLNIAGRVVRRVVTDRPASEGAQALAWDLRSDGGSAVPAGRYIVRLTARAEDGAAVSALAPLDVRR